MNTKSKNKTIKKLAVVALLSVIILILTATAAFVFFFVDLEGEREIIEIPHFVGKRFETVGAFENILIESELTFSDAVPEGEIISQAPYGGAKRKIARGEACTVRLVVSLGQERLNIPELCGFKYAEAGAVLRAIGAKIKIVSVYDDGVEADVVLRTSPEAGEGLEKGDTVTLFVSRNHVNAPIRVRDYTGRAIELASAEILAQGLSLGEVLYEYNDALSEGTVISQSIAPEMLVAHGSRIDVVVSSGKRVEELHPFRGDITEENGEINGNN